MRPNFPGLLSKYLLSKFPPRSAHGPGRFLVILSCQIDEFSPDLLVKSDDIQPLLQKVFLAFEWSPNGLSYGVFPSSTRSWTFRR